MKLTRSLFATTLLSSSILLLSACNDDKKTMPMEADPQPQAVETTETTKKDTVALVNGHAISALELQNALIMRSQTPGGKNVDANIVLQEIINLEVLRQEAEKQGITNIPVVLAEIKRQTTAVLANYLIREQFKNLKITDEQLKAEYDKQVTNLPKKEYKASHILVKTEDEAKTIIESLASGADFVALAKEKSTGPSGVKGGDLGWFQTESMVPEFSTAVKAMEKGQVSKTPVKTQFGYHVLLLEDSRAIAPPAIESMKEQLEKIIINNILKNYLEDITKNAKIEIIPQEEAPAPVDGLPTIQKMDK
jgi:peptidyl-prolyl cis-trans isomerase C